MEAIILAGGEGKRLRPLTENRPKPMIEVSGKPILLHQIEHLRSHGVGRFVIACRYKWEMIRDFLGDGNDFGIEIEYCVEKEPLGRGGAIKQAYRMVSNKDLPVIATNGDNLFDVDITRLIKKHRDSKQSITITLVPLKSPYGIVNIEGDLVKEFREKIVLPHWVNAGVYVLSPDALEHFPGKGDHEESTFPQFAKEGKIGAYLHRGFWKGIDNAKDISEAEEFLSNYPS